MEYQDLRIRYMRYKAYEGVCTVLAVWVWGNAKKVLRETPPSCSNVPTKSFPFSEKVFMPALRHAELASLIFVPGYGQYGGPVGSFFSPREKFRGDERSTKVSHKVVAAGTRLTRACVAVS